MSRFLFLVVIALVPFNAHSSQWEVDANASRLEFQALQSGQPFQGHFETWNASIEFDPLNLENSSVDVAIDMTSATTNDPERDSLMLDDPWLDVRQYPTANFKSQNFSSLEDNTYQTQASLTIKDVSRSVSLPLTLIIDSDHALATASLTIQRSDFNVGKGFWSATLVSEAVTITFSILAQRR